MQCTSDRSYVGFFPRFIAYLIDLLCVGIISGTVATVSTIFKAFGMEDVVNKGILFQYSVIAILTYIIKKLYFVIFVASNGQTLGKMCFRIKVVNEDGGKVTFWNALYRETIGRYLTEVVYFLGYIGILADKEKRAIHDWLCDTRVIYDTNINNEPIYNRQLYAPVKRPENPSVDMPLNKPINQVNNPFFAVSNENITNDIIQEKKNDIKDVKNDILVQEQVEQNVEKETNNINETLEKENLQQDVLVGNIVEEKEEILEAEEDVVGELLQDIQIELPEQEIKEETLIIEENSISDTDNQVDTISVEAEEKKDIVSAYGKDLDYSTEFVIDEEDTEVSYDTTELDELLDKLNGKNEEK